MNKKKPKPKPAPIIPAWTCPKCGATHPITVTTCCSPPIDKTMYPPPMIPPWNPWPPPVICGANR